ncbi:MAG: NirF protein [Candidatus Brocadia sp. WS118]|nr:MAG: NirF protein [Candidatus Brocadia sp. WS118]
MLYIKFKSGNVRHYEQSKAIQFSYIKLLHTICIIITTGLFILSAFTPALAEKVYVVERERERLAVIKNSILSSEIGNLGNLNHATVKFNKNFMYVISRDGCLSKIDTGSDSLLIQVKAGKSGIGFIFIDDMVAVANYDPHDVVILDGSLNTLKKIETNSKNVGIKSWERFLIFALMDKDEIWVLDSKKNFKVHKTIKNTGSMPFDALMSENKYIVGLFNEGSVGMLDAKTMSYSRRDLRRNEGEAVFKIPHFGTWGVYKDTAFIPAVGERRLHIVDINSFKHIGYIDLIGLPVFAAISADGRYIAVNYSGDKEDFLTVIDTKSRKVLNDIKVGKRIMHIRFSDDSRRLYLSSYFDNAVRVLDTNEWKVLNEITVPTPSGIFILPAVNKVN